MSDDAAWRRNGVLSGALAFLLWGAFPIYFKVAEGVSALEMLAHRVVWAVPFGLIIVLLRRQWPEVRRIVRAPRTLWLLILSACVIAANWLVYIYAIQADQIFQASLGYYINPLLFVLAGFIFLGERLRKLQTLAVVLAAAGVGVLAVQGGQFPLVSITLAVTFTVYSLIRKQVVVGAMPGLFVETIVLLPLAVLYLFYLGASDQLAFGLDQSRLSLLLLLAGPFTVLPLLFFAIGARRLRLATIGFLQFIGPTLQFLLALYYGETLTPAHLVCFGLIWSAVAVFIMDAFLGRTTQT
ncbi:MAG: EamA family transporter RarD [Gammaproteobacteria bacterium]